MATKRKAVEIETESEHKVSDETKTVRKKATRYCSAEGCFAKSHFGFEFKKPTHCGTHKDPLMGNATSLFCEFPGCKTQSRNFNFKGLMGKFCRVHKQPKMVSVYHVCDFGDCAIQGRNYGFPDEPERFCSTHKTDDMTNFNKKHAHFQCVQI